MIANVLFVAAAVCVLTALGRGIWPTHLATTVPPVADAPRHQPRRPKVPQHTDASTGRWLHECEQILAAGTGRHRANRRLVWAR